GDRADQQHGALARDHDCAAGLAGDLTGFDGDRTTAVLEALGNFRHVGNSLESLAMNRPGPMPLPGGMPPARQKKAAAHFCAAAGSVSATQAELLDQRLVAGDILAVQVVEQAATLVDHLQQAAA